LNFFAFV